MNLLKKKVVKETAIVQENIAQCILLIEQSLIGQVFTDTVTDVSYNGKDFYAQDNNLGRFKLNLTVESNDLLKIIKQIANYTLKPFNNKCPILDVAFGNYRLTAIHPSLARNNNEKVPTFSLRKISPTVKIKNNDLNLCPLIIHKLLSVLIKSYQSIIISGATGSGKTELQKYLISLMNPNDRLILIEESYETYIKEIYDFMDITSWMVNNNTNQMSELIKLALRNNPDWIIVAETRGKEAFDMVQSVMTGHPIITTLHSDSANNSLKRIIQMYKKEIDFDESMMLNTIANHLKIGIHVEKIFYQERKIYLRRIVEIVEYIPTNTGYQVNSLFKLKNPSDNQDIYDYGYMSKQLIDKLQFHHQQLNDLRIFIKEKVNEI